MRGGPESFTGLPGMILGVALPHDNTTWFATQVTNKIVNEKDLIRSTKGKRINRMEFEEQLKKSIQLLKEAGQPILLSFTL